MPRQLLAKSVLAICACAASISTCALADTPKAIDVPPGNLGAALELLQKEAGLDLVFLADDVKGFKTHGVKGTLDPIVAVKRLLQGTPLQLHSDASGALLILLPRHKSPAERSHAPSSNGTPGPPIALQEVVVTGSHIRGAPAASPVLELTRDQIEEAGQTDLGQAIRSLPENFPGGQNPGVLHGSGSLSNQNNTGGSALDLRGLGPDATLTLLNGRRMSYGGIGQTVDVSAIPLAAVDRIEIVADGASAIYGSDAVGGVANVILRPDYSGLDASARVGDSTASGDFQQQYGLVGGEKWPSGGFIAALSTEDDNAIDAQQRDYTRYLQDPYSLLPSSFTRQALISGHQSLGAVATFKIDALYSHRESNDFLNYYGTVYASGIEDTNYSISPTLSFQLPHNWSLSVNALQAHDRDIVGQNVSATGSTPFSTAQCYCNTVQSYEADSEGALFHLPAGDARLAAGGGFRKETLDDYDLTDTAALSASRHSYYEFGELYIPVLAPQQEVPEIDLLALSAAIRHESYSDFGAVTTPKIGLVYEPTPDFSAKASWGRSFKAPTLFEAYQLQYAELWPAATLGATGVPASATALVHDGGNPNLRPERASTWTATLEVHPRALSRLNAQLSYFHIDYNDRVIQPVTNAAAAFNDPAYRPYLTYNPSTTQQQSLIDSVSTGLSNLTGGAYDPASVLAIVQDLFINVASQRIHGVDLSGDYRVDVGRGRLLVSANASWLASTQRNGLGDPAYDLAGTIYNPPHWRARSGLTWQYGPAEVAAFYNFIGGVADDTQTPSVQGGAMQTLDLSGAYDLGVALGWSRSLNVQLSVQNLLNARPPFLQNPDPYTVDYDSTNYSPVGRFVGLSVAARLF